MKGSAVRIRASALRLAGIFVDFVVYVGDSRTPAEHLDVESGDEYWISGCKRDGSDRLYGERVSVEIDGDAYCVNTFRGRSALTTYWPASTISEIFRSTHKLASTYASSAESPEVVET